MIGLLSELPIERIVKRALLSDGGFEKPPSKAVHMATLEFWCATPADLAEVVGRSADFDAFALLGRVLSGGVHRPILKAYMLDEHKTDLGATPAGALYLANPDQPVVKTMLLAHRKPELSQCDFVNYYENHHAKVIEAVVTPPIARYYRRFLTPISHLDGDPDRAGDALMMEMWFHTQRDLLALHTMVFDAASYRYPELACYYVADEYRLFDKPSMNYYTIDER